MSTRLNLIVLRARDLEATAGFYRTLGFSFKLEQHGNGPQHLASEADGLVLEIYPGQEGTAPDRKSAGATLLGFKVEALDSVLAEIRQLGCTILSGPTDSPWGRRAVAMDPDGRAVEISQ